MNRKKATPWTALLLALVLALTGCGGKPAAQSEALSAPVYIPRSLPCPLPLETVTACCAMDGALYAAGTMPEETDEAGSWGFSASSSADGEGEVYSNLSRGRPALFRLDLETGAAEEVAGYAPVPAAEDGRAVITALASGGDGTLWVLEETQVDREMDSDINVDGETIRFYESETAARRWRRLDSAGGERESMDVGALTGHLGEIDGTLADPSGRLWAVGSDTLTVLDGSGQTIFSQSAQGLTGTLVGLGGGTVGALTDAGTVRTADLEAGAWGPELPLPGSAGKLYAGEGETLFCCTAGDSLYRYVPGGGSGERMLSWSGAGVDQSAVRGLALLPEGRAAVLLGEQGAYELMALTPASQEELAGRTVLTLATMGLSSDIRAKVLDFNRTSASCRIAVQDYSEFNVGNDPSAGLTRLQTELAAGRMPDLLDVSGDIPLRQYAARGLLEDLWPYIDADPELSREGLMDRPLEAASMGGRLYQVFSGFSMETAAGAVSAVGDRMGWTLEELREALAAMPAGCGVLGPEDTSASLFETLTAQNLDRWIDWEAGTADFTGADFLSVLDFCASLPREAGAEEAGEDAYSRAARGEQLLIPEEVSGFYTPQLCRATFGGEAAFVGYPSENGCGSSFRASEGLAMSSACGDKEGAWSFLRRLLLPGGCTAFDQFPVNRADFDRLADKAMYPEYAVDENGDPITGADGKPLMAFTAVWIINGQVFMMEEVTQADYDRVMALYDRIDKLAGRDERAWGIVQECAADFFGGGRGLEETAQAIQSRMELYLNELK